MLISGKSDEEVMSSYPELDGLTLPIQLEISKQPYKEELLHEERNVCCDMEHAVRFYFLNVDSRMLIV